MSKECCICGKKRQSGQNVSHSNIKTKRVFNANLQKVRMVLPSGEVCTKNVCTSCIRSGFITKPGPSAVAQSAAQ